jgi:hypothetical protein
VLRYPSAANRPAAAARISSRRRGTAGDEAVIQPFWHPSRSIPGCFPDEVRDFTLAGASDRTHQYAIYEAYKTYTMVCTVTSEVEDK